MKERFIQTARTAAPVVLMLGFESAMDAQSSGGLNAGLAQTTSTSYRILAWLRGIAIVGFMITFVWGCLECAFESWREGWPRLFASVVCAIAAGLVQGIISGFYSTNG